MGLARLRGTVAFGRLSETCKNSVDIVGVQYTHTF
jgi:hypothetical protein